MPGALVEAEARKRLGVARAGVNLRPEWNIKHGKMAHLEDLRHVAPDDEAGDLLDEPHRVGLRREEGMDGRSVRGVTGRQAACAPLAARMV